MSSSVQVRQQLKEILESLSGNEVSDFSINLRDLGLDSLKTMDLVLSIEDTFGIEIPDDALIPKNLETPQSVLDMLGSLIK